MWNPLTELCPFLLTLYKLSPTINIFFAPTQFAFTHSLPQFPSPFFFFFPLLFFYFLSFQTEPVELQIQWKMTRKVRTKTRWESHLKEVRLNLKYSENFCRKWKLQHQWLGFSERSGETMKAPQPPLLHRLATTLQRGIPMPEPRWQNLPWMSFLES